MDVRRKKALAFRAIALSIPIVLFLIVEGVCRLFTPGFNDDPFLNFTSPVSLFSKVREGGEEYFKVTHPEAYRAGNVKFTTHKKPNTVRIMCLGESASSGWPHPGRETYSAYLGDALTTAFPGKNIEVLNIGVPAYASYRLRMVFDDLIHYEPDLIVNWIGNNEFIENRTYLQKSGVAPLLNKLAGSLRVVQLTKGLLARRLHPENTMTGARRQFKSAATWGFIKKVSLDLRKDPAQFADVKEHYAYIMDYMAREAAARHVPMFMLTVPVNLRDWKPNVSSNQTTGAALEAWRAAYYAGRKALYEGNLKEAIARLREATKLDPVSADTHFYLARALEAHGEYPAAYAEYLAASDFDYNPFRAISAFRETVRGLPARFPAVHVVDAERLMAAGAVNGLPGFDLFLDYVHPTKKGNLLIAKAVYDDILAQNLVGVPPVSREFRRTDHLSDGEPYDELHDVNVQGTEVHLYMQMHQDEAVIAKAKTIIQENLADSPDLASPVNEQLIHAVSAYLSLEEREIRGIPVAPAERESILAGYDAEYTAMFGKKLMTGAAPEDEADEAAPAHSAAPESAAAPARAAAPSAPIAAPAPTPASGGCPGDMVPIPGGTFQMGSKEGVGKKMEHPRHPETVASFCMDRTKVTVAAYRACVTRGGCSVPIGTEGCNWRADGREDHPINCVDWAQAKAFCESSSKRLPLEREWEYAARGVEHRTYPWGELAPATQLCWDGEGSDLVHVGLRTGTCKVGSYPAGNTPLGVEDMAGNVWEWVEDLYCPYQGQGCSETMRVTRGGAWNSIYRWFLSSAARAGNPPSTRRNDVGIRCAWTKPS